MMQLAQSKVKKTKKMINSDQFIYSAISISLFYNTYHEYVFVGLEVASVQDITKLVIGVWNVLIADNDGNNGDDASS